MHHEQADPIAIAPGVAGEGPQLRHADDAGAGERLPKDLPLHCKLGLIDGVLIVAAAAALVVFAGGEGACRGCLQHGVHRGRGVASPLGRKRRLDQLARQCTWNEHGLSRGLRASLRRHAGQHASAIERLLHAQLHVTHPVSYKKG
jgi:hypothetical protein